MTYSELRSMTVVQLRKLAREHHIVLGAGIEKTAIIAKIASSLGIHSDDEQLPVLNPDNQSAFSPEISDYPPDQMTAPALENDWRDDPMTAVNADSMDSDKEIPSVESSSKELHEKDDPEEKISSEAQAAPAEPRFQAAWHSADMLHTQSRSTFTAPAAARPAWQNPGASIRPAAPEQRQPLRSHSFGPRFGPGAAQRTEQASVSPAAEEEKPQSPLSPLPDHRMGTAAPVPYSPVTPAMASPAAAPVISDSTTRESSASVSGDSGIPSLEELLASGEYEDGSGILELHPDGYGFLRASNYMPSSKDIYVSQAQIRRFGLRTGDLIQGKIRPPQDGDKYAALLYIDTVNEQTEEEASHRPIFEELTPTYPTRRISLEAVSGESLPDMRLIDLIAPLGFGQRGLIFCPPDTGKRELLIHYANTISANYPDAQVLMLLIDITPEDATLIREIVKCPVLASTFDQSPDTHLRLTEMVIERAMRLVEQKKDVVILADSLTRLAKIYTSSAVQQGRTVPGMVNPASLMRAKRMFGAARALKEGGSLTVIATMDIASGNKVNDSLMEEFKGTANMELMLDASLALAGISPAIQLQRSFTKKSDLLLNDRQKEGLALIRQMLGTTSSAAAIPQLISMMDKTSSNQDLLLKIKDWFALMNM